MAQNPAIIPYVEEYWDKIEPFNLSRNPGASEYLYRIPHDQIDWHYIALRSDNLQFMEEHIQYLDGFNLSLLSLNPHAIPLLEANPSLINWLYLSKNPNAIHILEANLDKVHWDSLCENPNAIHIIEANREQLDRYDWNILSVNPAIFTLDYQAMYDQMTPFREELLSVIMHPDNIARLCPELVCRLTKKRSYELISD